MSTQQATTQQPLLQAIDLKKHYPVKKGIFAPERLVKALDGVSFTLERGKTLAVDPHRRRALLSGAGSA